MPDTKDHDIEALIARIDLNLSEFRREANIINRYNSHITQDIERLISGLMETYVSSLKSFITDPSKGVHSLRTFQLQIEMQRLSYLKRFLEDAIPKLRGRLVSPFWIGNQGVALAELSELEQSIASSDEEPSKPLDKLTKASSSLRSFEDIIRKLEQERQVSRMKAPVKTLLWGLPIWIGIAFSGRFGIFGNLLCFSIVLVSALISFILANRKMRTLGTSRLGFKLPFSLSGDSSITLLYILAPLGMLLALTPLMTDLRSSFASYIDPDKTVVTNDSLIEGKPGEVIQPKLTIGTEAGILYRVRAIIVSPLISTAAAAEVSAINTPSVVLPLSLKIAEDAPTGNFPAVLNISYEREVNTFIYSGRIDKTNRINIRLVINK